MAGEPRTFEPRTGNFQGDDAPVYDDILKCMHCGLCLPTCPTYSLTGRERSSPRGRIQLMKGIADGQLDLSAAFAEEMYLCLGCLACETACPAGVPYGRLLEASRTEVQLQRPLPLLQRMAARVAFWPFEQLTVLRLGSRLLRWVDRLGLRAWARRAGLFRLVPGPLVAQEELLPPVPARPSSQTLARVTPARGEPVGRVAVLLGCVMDVLCAEENEATVRVLARQGCEVVSVAESCCGALHAHAGDMVRARRLAKQSIAAFEAAGVEAIILNSAGCGAAMKQYGHWFHDDPVWAERAAAHSARVMDLSEWLVAHGLRQEGLVGLRQRVTWDDPCHLIHGQGISAQPRAILQQVPGLQLVELPEADWCCGSAGIYNLTHPVEAMQTLDRKMANLRRTGASILVTSNPGCLLQLRFGARQAGLDCEVVHLAVLLDRAYGGPGS